MYTRFKVKISEALHAGNVHIHNVMYFSLPADVKVGDNFNTLADQGSRDRKLPLKFYGTSSRAVYVVFNTRTLCVRDRETWVALGKCLTSKLTNLTHPIRPSKGASN